MGNTIYSVITAAAGHFIWIVRIHWIDTGERRLVLDVNDLRRILLKQRIECRIL